MINLKFLSKVSRASILLAFFYLLSRLVGLWRDRILASRFGATDLLDVCYVSFNIPDLVFNLLVAGAISSALIPVFIEYQAKKSGEEWKLTSNFLNWLLLGAIGLSIILYLFAPVIVSLVAPGFWGPKRDLAILFTRVMLVSPVIFSISVVLGSLLQVFHRFLAYAIAPAMYNIGIIFGAVFFVPRFGPLGLAEGVVLGAVLHLLIQLPSIWKTGSRWQAILRWNETGLRKIFRLALPRTLGLVGGHINWIILNAIASTIGLGAVAIFNLANNLQYLPVALVGISVAVASSPSLSREALQEDKKEFVRRVEGYLRQVVFWALPFSLLLFLVREEVVRVILQAGSFSTFDASATAKILGFFLWGAFSQSLVPVLSRSFYALHNTKTPAVIGLLSVVMNVLLAFYLVKNFHWGLEGLALTFSLSGIFNASVLFIYLKKSIISFSPLSFLDHLGRVLIASLGMGLVWHFLPISSLGGEAGLGPEIYRLAIFSALAVLTFLGLSYILRIRFSR